MGRHTIVVSGMGAASALGTGLRAHREALWAGRDGFRPIERFDTRQMGTSLGAMWPGWDGRSQPETGGEIDLVASSAPFPLHELALVAAREAWSSARVSADRTRVALVFGTCYGQGFADFDRVAERVASGLEIGGPRITISTACSSSTNAVGLGRDLLVRGHADVVVAGGADVLLREAVAGFSALGVLSREPCAPFSQPTGTTLAEGAGFLVLERGEDVALRGVEPWGTIEGYGLSADAHHETSPDPSGEGIARAIRGALADAGWTASDIDYVSAHATGTENNDHIEWSVIQRELGPALVSGSKGHLGHTQGAAGVLELILALLCHREGCVPPTLHFRGPRPGCPADPVAASAPRAANVKRGLKLSAAFGGANAVVAYTPGDRSADRPSSRATPVTVVGAGLVCPSGALRLPRVLSLTERRTVGACETPDLHELGVDPRRLDRSARNLTAAATLALPSGKDLSRTGLFLAATRTPVESSKRCTDSIRQRGIAGTSASAFARMSVNAPAGACAQALGLLGPTSTVSVAEGTSLLAVVLAAEWLAWRADAERLLAGAVDELPGLRADETEGAACIALERTQGPVDGAVIAKSWGISGPAAPGHAAERAMQGCAGVDGVIAEGPCGDLARWLRPGAPVGVIGLERFWGTSASAGGCVVAALGAAHVASGARSVLVVSTRGTTRVALLLERGGRS